jgi:hypothetical protein
MKTGFSYFGVRRVEHVRADLAAMRDEGCTQVLHTWSEEDLAYYEDTMGRIVSESHALGLHVYANAWGVGRVFGGEANSELSSRNPGSCQVMSNGEPVAAICPNHPAFLEYMDGWIDSVCASGVDTVFWDEPHFFFRKGRVGEWACRCSSCRSLYADRFGADMPVQSCPEVALFRQERLLRLLERWTSRVRSKGKRNNVCLLPDTFDAGLPDWNVVASLPALDELSTDPYWLDDDPLDKVVEDYTTYSKRLVEICGLHGLEPQMWFKLYRIRAGTEHFAPEAARIAHAAGIRNLMSWSWRGSDAMSWLRCDDPPAAHSAMVSTYRRLSPGS